MNVLITGVAGFIGAAVAETLLTRGEAIVGVDSLNDYYDVRLKRARLERLAGKKRFKFERLDLINRSATASLFKRYKFDSVVHLAAQAGVRYSVQNPSAYVDTNLVGFGNILEGCRHNGVRHLVFASSSSVYGASTKVPFSEHDNVDHPVSLYAATKKANELMAHSYAHLYGLPCTGLRFFTVYGPWGRPDMALFKFTAGILAGNAIPVFNNGDMQRDFTYIDDIVRGVVAVIERPAEANLKWTSAAPDPATSHAPYRILNIGNNRPEKLMRYIAVLEDSLGKKAILDLLPMQPGDVPMTMADVTEINSLVGFQPSVSIDRGVRAFVDWYCSFYSC